MRGLSLHTLTQGRPKIFREVRANTLQSIRVWRKEMKVAYDKQHDLLDLSTGVHIIDGSSIEEDVGVVLHFGTDGGCDIVAVSIMGASYWFKRGYDEASDTWLLGDTTSDPSLITNDGDFIGYWKPDEFDPDELPDPIGIKINHASKHLASVRHHFEEPALDAIKPQI